MKHISEEGVLARLTDRLKLALATKYLAWAEMLPEFRRGMISHLQTMRKFQREEAKRSLESCRLPAGVSFRYSLCIQMELFPIESIEALKSAIAGLFPENRSLGSRREFIHSSVPSLFAGGYDHVGLLVREPNPFFALPAAIVQSLPPEVEYIVVDVYKILPSAFVVCFSAFLNDRVTVKLQKLMNTIHLPATRFKQWIPHGFGAVAHSEVPADLIRDESVLGELVRLRTSLEDVIGRYFQGYFLAQGERQRPRLPAIERFDLVGLDSEEKEFRWGWGTPLGLDHGAIFFNGHREDKQIFVFSSGGRCDLPVTHRFIVFHESAEDPKVREERLHSPTEGLIGTIIGEIAVIEQLTQIRRVVEALRLRIYRRLAGNTFFMRFRVDIDLHRHLQRESLLLQRLALEVAQGEKLYASRRCAPASFQPINEKRMKDLGTELSARVHFQVDTISKHVDLVTKSFSDYVATRNMGLMYVLTIVATVATILAVIIATGEHWSWIRTAFHWLRSLFRS